MLYDNIISVMGDFGLQNDDVFIAYTKAFLESRPSCDDWIEFHEHIVAHYPEHDASMLMRQLRGVLDMLSVFKSMQKEDRCKVVDVKHVVCQDDAHACREHNNYKVDPDMKKRVLDAYFIQRETRPNLPPVLSKIDYLQQDRKAKKRYRDNLIVSDKGDRYI